jgi:hypothetical protein
VQAARAQEVAARERRERLRQELDTLQDDERQRRGNAG